MATKHIGENIVATVDGRKLTLEIDLSVTGTPSASGKSIIIASTRGSVSVDDVQVGVNVYRKR